MTATNEDDGMMNVLNNRFCQYMFEIEGLEPIGAWLRRSGQMFWLRDLIDRDFRDSLAQGMLELGVSEEQLRRDYSRLHKDERALNNLFRCLAKRARTPLRSGCWKRVSPTVYTPPPGQSRKPGSHKGPP
jgi:hypothetical protein